MPNICDARFRVHGEDKAMLLKFYIDMARVTGSFGGLTEEERTELNDDGTTTIADSDWFGNIYVAGGYRYDEIHKRKMYCRGWNITVDMARSTRGEVCIEITAEMAWSSPVEEMQRMIREKYPGIEVSSYAEEPGCGIYLNDDETGEYFPERYKIEWCNKDGDWDVEYYSAEQEDDFVRKISKLTGKEWVNAAEILAHEGEVRELFTEHNPGDEAYLSFNQFTTC